VRLAKVIVVEVKGAAPQRILSSRGVLGPKLAPVTRTWTQCSMYSRNSVYWRQGSAEETIGCCVVDDFGLREGIAKKYRCPDSGK